MNRHISLYLDAVRFTAAMLVFLSHAKLDELNGAWIGAWGLFGREAVIIFFVLSGFVIAHVSSTREKGGVDYAASRLARLYSVVLPGLILTVVADQIGRAIDPALYAADWYVDSHPVPRFLVSLLLLNEVWLESVRPFSNGPFWSISYEASYYLIFGLWVFLDTRYRLWAVLAAMALVGPKILLLFPAWLLGVAVYRLNQRWTAPRAMGWVLFLGSIAALVALSELRFANRALDLSIAWLGEELVMGQLHYSKFFLSSYVVAVLVVANFIGVNAISRDIGPLLERVARPIRIAAGFTFSIYLFHYPLLHMFRSITDSSLAICALTLATVGVLGTYTERRKDWYKRVLTSAILTCRSLLGSRVRAASP